MGISLTDVASALVASAHRSDDPLHPWTFAAGGDLRIIESGGLQRWVPTDLRDFADLVHPSDLDAVRDAAQHSGSVTHRLADPAYAEMWIETTFFTILVNGDTSPGGEAAVLGKCRDVTSKLDAYLQLERQQHLLERLALVQDETLAKDDISAAFSRILDLSLEVTGSAFGLVGEILDTDTGPVLWPRAATDITWDAASREAVAASPAGLRFDRLDSLYGAVMTTGEVVIAGDLADERRCGTPPGHPPIVSFLGVPFVTSDGDRGMIGLANRDGGYDEGVVSLLEPITAAAAALLAAFATRRARTRAEDALEISRRVDQVLAELVIRLSDVGGLSDASVDAALGVIGSVVDADRSYVFQFDQAAGTMSNAYEWCADGVEPARHLLQDLPMDAYPWALSVLQRGEAVVAETSSLPPEAAAEREILEAQGIHSVMWFPLHTNGELSGLVGFDDVSGDREWRDTEAMVLRSFAGELSAVLSRKHVLAELRASEERLRVFTERLDVGIFIADTGFRHGIYINPAFEALFGITPDEFATNPRALVEVVHPDDRDALASAGKSRLGGTGVIDETGLVDHTCRLTRDGTERWVRILAFPIDPPGPTRRVAGLVEDISERHALQDELLDTMARLATANRSKTEFLSRVSHELRTPLHSAIGFLQLVRMDPDNVQREEFLANAELAAHALVDLVDDLLDVSRIDSGHVRLVKANVDVVEVAHEAVTLNTPLLDAHRVTASVVVNQPVTVFTDRRRLFQILTNLVSNAAKYNRPGGTVRIVVESTSSEIVVQVIDSGRGLTAQQIDRLFVPFDRLGAENSEVSGTGIGLALARQLTQALGGRLEVASVPGEGSSFTVRLPAGQESSGDGYTVLVVDDNPDTLRVLDTALRRLDGVRVQCTTQIADALAGVTESGADLVLLDRHLPEGDGIDFVPSFRELGSLERPLEVAMISADAKRESRDDASAAGAVGYFVKPLNFSEILAFVRERAARQRRR